MRSLGFAWRWHFFGGLADHRQQNRTIDPLRTTIAGGTRRCGRVRDSQKCRFDRIFKLLRAVPERINWNSVNDFILNTQFHSEHTILFQVSIICFLRIALCARPSNARPEYCHSVSSKSTFVSRSVANAGCSYCGCGCLNWS